MGDVLAINDQVSLENPKVQKRHQIPLHAEDLSSRFLMVGTDERGTRCWFIRLRTAGLHERRFGPFQRRSEAIEHYDWFLEQVLVAICDVGNNCNRHALIQLPRRLRPKGVAR